MKSPADVRRIIRTLAKQHPNADTELHYRNAVRAARRDYPVRAIDRRACKHRHAGSLCPLSRRGSLAAASTAQLEKLILSTGFFRQKAKALIGMSRQLVEQHDGQVPADMEALTALPGVGRKTANVVLGHALGVPGLPVDRHVLRVVKPNRDLANSDEPERSKRSSARRCRRACGRLHPTCRSCTAAASADPNRCAAAARCARIASTIVGSCRPRGAPPTEERSAT